MSRVAQAEQPPDLLVVAASSASRSAAREPAHVALVDDERGVDERREDPQQQLGVVGRVRRAGGEAAGRLAQRPRARARASRARGASRGRPPPACPHAIVSITCAVRCEPLVGLVERARVGEEAREGDRVRRLHQQRARPGRAPRRSRGARAAASSRRRSSPVASPSLGDTARSTVEIDARRRLRGQGMRLPVPPRDLRPDLRAGHAGDAVLHRLPEADGPPLRRRRRRRDRAGEGRGPARLRRPRGARRARRGPGAASSSPPRARSSGAGASTSRGDLERHVHRDRRDGRHATSTSRVYEDAERRAMLVNVVDVPPLCNFILPAIVRTGPLAIAISTAGASPALAKRIKRQIADEFGEPYARLAVLLNEVARLGEGHAAHLPGPQGVLRGHRQRRARPDRAAARRGRGRRPRPHRRRAARRPRDAGGRRGVIDLDDVRGAAARLDGIGAPHAAVTSRTLDERTGAAVGSSPRTCSASAPSSSAAPTTRSPRCRAPSATAASSPPPRATTRRRSRWPRRCTARRRRSSCRRTRRASKAAATEGYGARIVRFDRYADDREALMAAWRRARGADRRPPLRRRARDGRARARPRSS